MWTSRRAIQDHPTSNAELTIEELEEVRGGDYLDDIRDMVLPAPPPADSPYRSQWNSAQQEMTNGTLNIGTGITTIARAPDDGSLSELAQRFVGVHQIGTGIVRMANGYEAMSEAHQKHLQDQREQAEEAEERELAELEAAKEAQEEQEREDNRLLRESDDLLREDGAPAGPGSSGGAPPANADPYPEQLPSFPTNIINAPPPHEPEIRIEPTDAGAGYSANAPGRLY